MPKNKFGNYTYYTHHYILLLYLITLIAKSSISIRSDRNTSANTKLKKKEIQNEQFKPMQQLIILNYAAVKHAK